MTKKKRQKTCRTNHNSNTLSSYDYLFLIVYIPRVYLVAYLFLLPHIYIESGWKRNKKKEDSFFFLKIKK
jgi:hypothetical protein